MVRLVEVAVWWLVTVLFWLATLSAVSRAELLVAVLAGLPCAVAATAARAAGGWRWRVKPHWLAWFGPLVPAAVADTLRVFGRAVREARAGRRAPRRGAERELRRIPLPSGEDPAQTDGRRAVAAGFVSATPGTVVLDSPPDERVLLVHALDSRPSPVERVVAAG
jgi:multisubunit Na+/H+ antiporter MnhE subunit